jgi:hypothetical protein
MALLMQTIAMPLNLSSNFKISLHQKEPFLAIDGKLPAS